jgi:hypothetical protein
MFEFVYKKLQYALLTESNILQDVHLLLGHGPCIELSYITVLKESLNICSVCMSALDVGNVRMKMEHTISEMVKQGPFYKRTKLTV